MEKNDETLMFLTQHTFDAVILCNGHFPTHPIALQVLHTAAFLCCCDGAATACLQHGITPQAIVGDGDSLPKTIKSRYSGIIHTVSEQDDNDMTKATRFCMERGARHIAYIGATGKREDHTLGNISLLAYYYNELNLQPVMYTDYGMFIPASGRHTFSSFASQQVSIFNINCSTLSSEGLRWNCYPYRQLWQGTLNEAVGNSFTIHGDHTYIIYQTYRKNGMPVWVTFALPLHKADGIYNPQNEAFRLSRTNRIIS